jgi:hypothetical protein
LDFLNFFVAFYLFPAFSLLFEFLHNCVGFSMCLLLLLLVVEAGGGGLMQIELSCFLLAVESICSSSIFRGPIYEMAG